MRYSAELAKQDNLAKTQKKRLNDESNRLLLLVFFWYALRDSNSRPSYPLWASRSALLLHTGGCGDSMLISLGQKFGSRLRNDDGTEN
jgi:hypothetical protein